MGQMKIEEQLQFVTKSYNLTKKRVKSLMKSTRDFLIDTLSYPDITVDDFYETGMNIRTYRRQFEFLILNCV